MSDDEHGTPQISDENRDTVGPRANPFAGPRSLAKNDPIFGREREITELVDLLIAERIVVLYSPSGAGKTSLVQAGLLSDADFTAKFHIFETVRFGWLPNGAEQDESGAGVDESAPREAHHDNPYMEQLFASIRSTERRENAPGSAEPEDSAPITLDRLLGSYEETDENGWIFPQLLIFDQFEEIVAQDAAQKQVKQAFFMELGEALQKPHRWALFVLREDYLAALDPYRFLLPTRFTNRYRLEFLTRRGARSAIRETAATAATDFELPAAEHVLDELSSYQQTAAEGSAVPPIDAEVDPLQLQIVCRAIWDRAADDGRITLAEVQEVGNVREILQDYYSRLVERIAEQTGITQRVIRDWIQSNLIVEDRYRGQIRIVGDAEADIIGLGRAAFDGLEEGHLVRIELRLGSPWCELVHDRLVELIVRDNAQWRETNLSLLQRSATLWEEKRPDALLLRDEPLREAEKWAEANDDDLTDLDREFLKKSQGARVEAQQRERNRRILYGLSIVALIFGIVAVVFYVQAERNARLAEENAALADQNAEAEVIARQTAVANEQDAIRNADLAERAEATAVAERAVAEQQRAVAQQQVARRLAQDAKLLSGTELDKSLLISLGINDALSRTVESNASLIGRLTDELLLLTHLHGQQEAVQDLAVGPEGRLAAAGNLDGSIMIWNIGAPHAPPTKLTNPLDPAVAVKRVVWLHSGDMLGFGDAIGRAGLWSIDDEHSIRLFDDRHSNPAEVTAAAIRAGDRLMATGNCGGFDSANNYRCNLGEILLWQLDGPDARGPIHASAVLTAHQSIPTSLAFHPSLPLLASAGCTTGSDGRQCTQGQIRLWDVEDASRPAPIGAPLSGHKGQISAVAFSPDGATLASGGLDGAVILWTLGEVTAIIPISTTLGPTHNGSVLDLTYNDDGSLLASSSCAEFDDRGCIKGAVFVWDTRTRQRVYVLDSHTTWVGAVVFYDHYLASGGWDRRVILWDLTMHDTFARRLNGQSTQVSNSAFNPSSVLLASAGGREIHIWDVAGAQTVVTLTADLGEGGEFLSVAFSPDGQVLAAGDNAGRLWRWETRKWAALASLPPLEAGITSLAYQPKGHILVSGSTTGSIVFWDTPTYSASDPVQAHASRAVGSLAFDPDGKWLLSGGWDGRLALWDMQTLTTVANIANVGGLVEDVAISFDGRILAYADRVGTPFLWDRDEMETEIPQRLSLASGLNVPTGRIASSPVSPLLVGGSAYDGSIMLWDTKSKLAIGDAVQAHNPNYVSDVIISPDGRWLASGDSGGTVLLWPLESEVWREKACEIANRDFTETEWKEYFGEQGLIALCAPTLSRYD